MRVYNTTSEAEFREICKDRIEELGITEIIDYDGMHKNCIFVDHIGEFRMTPYRMKNGVKPTSYSYPNKNTYVHYILQQNNTQYKNGEIKVLSKIISKQDKVYVQDKYGICKVRCISLIRNAKTSFQSAINQLDYFKNQVYEKSEAYRNGNFEIIEFFDGLHLLIKDKYGLCKVHRSNLLNGSSASVSSSLDKDAYIINKFKEKHGDQFDYSKVKYVDNTTHVIITCKIHGDFPQTPTNHLGYRRCPKCKDEEDKFTRTALVKRVIKKGSGILYFIKIFSIDETFLKIGYTTNNTKKRFKSLKNYEYSYEVLKEVVTEDGDKLFNIELFLKNKFKKDKYIPIRPFPGSKTEVFRISKYEDILKDIEQFEITVL